MSTYLTQLSDDMNLIYPGTIFYFLLAYSISAFTFGQQSPSQEPEQNIDIKENSYQLLIIGGGIKACSSESKQHCLDGTFEDSAETSAKYYLARETLVNVLSVEAFSHLPETTKLQLNTVFEYFYANPVQLDGPRAIRQAFAQASSDFDAASLFSNLPNALYYAILDFTEIASDSQEIVKFTATENMASKSIFETFVKQAAVKQEPGNAVNLLFTTASARDHFAAINFYQSVLEQAAANALPDRQVIVNWLPLDQSLASLANKGQSCEHLAEQQASHQLYDRQRIHKNSFALQTEACQDTHLIRALLNNAHGLFINGGDQMRTLNSLSLAFEDGKTVGDIIKDKVNSDQLFVAGTSAGAAVLTGGVYQGRPVPMITGGRSDVALIRGAFALNRAPFGCEKDQNCPNGLLEDDLTYSPQGGLGLFNAGIIDTHFSERDRHGRLAMLAAFTKTRFGFGIDENSALLASAFNNKVQLKVIGENGVFIADMQNAIFKAQAGKHQIIGLSHYLRHGESAELNLTTNQLDFQPATNSVILNNKILLPIIQQGEFRRQIALNCGTQQFHRWTIDDIAWLVNPSEDTNFNRVEAFSTDGCSFTNLLFGVEN